MGKRRAMLYLVAGLLCAAVAVMVMKKQRGSGGGPTGPAEAKQIFVARERIAFGTPLAIYDAGTKKGNICLVNWPKDMVPEGALTEAKEITDSELVATTEFVRYEPVIKKRATPKAEMIPEGMFSYRYQVKPEDLAQYRAGDYVDLLVFEKDKGAREFARCLRIYAVGRMPWMEEATPADSKKGPEPLPPVIYLLAREKDRLKLVEAERMYRNQMLVLPVPGGRDCSEGPVVVGEVTGEVKVVPRPFPPDGPTKDEFKPAVLLAQAREKKENALKSEYPQCVQEAEQARTLLVQITAKAPERSGEFKEAQALLKELETLISTREMEQKWLEHEKLIQAALKTGNVPECLKLIQFAQGNFRELEKPFEEKIAGYMNRMEGLKKELKAKLELFQNLLNNNIRDKALDVYGDLKKNFPASEEAKAATQMLKDRKIID